ncbi:hypothetical protein [Martelella radicis]|uniref:Uncharacterized protein n=1 Tax=Martelella radicis TaxID=1397476 RepID=A0A7W6PBD9_9HYPH|nr:hypothetical protein [Martelella radicis]MBB4122544.1 hypothetical protein [Martelella radicis]
MAGQNLGFGLEEISLPARSAGADSGTFFSKAAVQRTGRPFRKGSIWKADAALATISMLRQLDKKQPVYVFRRASSTPMAGKRQASFLIVERRRIWPPPMLRDCSFAPRQPLPRPEKCGSLQVSPHRSKKRGRMTRNNGNRQ